MSTFIGPHATIRNGAVLPDGAQLGQKPLLSNSNPEFTAPIYIWERRQVLVLGPIGSRGELLTVVFGQGFHREKVYVYAGCFGGTLDDFEEAVLTRKNESDPHRAAYAAVIVMLRAIAPYRFEAWVDEDPAG